MATVALILTATLTAINIALAIRTVAREQRLKRHPIPHPLEASLQDIAQAIREAGGQT